ncbi:magnesium/cobalt transporter CorA [Hahella sp. NBU794]|uniref:magnesium/cobalt transporter CorA n=1 Tax=Hahella sp. NBU794 TaxID=3422590 RepID=UPI003D6E136B
MLKLFTIRDNGVHEVSSSVSQETLQAASWIDAQAPDAAERELLNALLPEDLPESSAVEEIESSARFFTDANGVHVHSLFLSNGDGRPRTVTVAFILQTQRLITLRQSDCADFGLFRTRAEKGQVEVAGPAQLLVALLEQKVGNLADVIEDTHRKLDHISHQVLEQGGDLQAAIGGLARVENLNGKVRLCLMDTERAISFLQRHAKPWPEMQQTCQEIMRDVETLMSHTTFLFEKINYLMDYTQGFINIHQNQIIKIFSIVSVVLLPPTLIASIYGMNFNYIPELKWLLGYPWAIGLMIVSAVTPYLYFKRKGWL